MRSDYPRPRQSSKEGRVSIIEEHLIIPTIREIAIFSEGLDNVISSHSLFVRRGHSKTFITSKLSSARKVTQVSVEILDVVVNTIEKLLHVHSIPRDDKFIDGRTFSNILTPKSANKVKISTIK